MVTEVYALQTRIILLILCVAHYDAMCLHNGELALARENLEML